MDDEPFPEPRMVQLCYAKMRHQASSCYEFYNLIFSLQQSFADVTKVRDTKKRILKIHVEILMPWYIVMEVRNSNYIFLSVSVSVILESDSQVWIWQAHVSLSIDGHCLTNDFLRSAASWYGCHNIYVFASCFMYNKQELFATWFWSGNLFLKNNFASDYLQIIFHRYYVEAETKWPLFSKRNFQKSFLD